MTDDNKKMIKFVEESLKKHGFPLEMEVAENLFNEKYDISNSERYIDPESGKEREIDIVATQSFPINSLGISIKVFLIIECKMSKTPWALFCTHRKHGFGALLGKMAKPAYFNSRNPVITQKAIRSINITFNFDKDSIGYNLLQVNSGPSKSDSAYEACMSVVKATNYFMETDEGIFGFIEKKVNVFIPIIAIDGSVVKCNYNKKIQIEEIDVGALHWKHRQISQRNSEIIVTKSANIGK